MEIMDTKLFAVICKIGNSCTVLEYIATDEETCVEYCEYIAQKNNMILEKEGWKNDKRILKIIPIKKDITF